MEEALIVEESLVAGPVPTLHLAQVAVTPDTIRLQVQKTARVDAIALDQFGDKVDDVSFIWSVSGPAGGIDEVGVFTAGTNAGMYEDAVVVMAIQGSVSLTASADVTVDPGMLDQVIIDPNPGEITIGSKQQFTAVTTDKFGNRVSMADVSWGVKGGGGTVNSRGMFIAGTEPGIFYNTISVTAEQAEIVRSGSASVLLPTSSLPSDISDLNVSLTLVGDQGGPLLAIVRPCAFSSPSTSPSLPKGLITTYDLRPMACAYLISPTTLLRCTRASYRHLIPPTTSSYLAIWHI